MKKALHDALGYLWVKNSLEADKKRKQEIADDNGRIRIAIDDRACFLFGVKWWHTTELGHVGIWLPGFPERLRWFPKDEFIKAFKANPKTGLRCGAWWNPKWGDMRDYFTEMEMSQIRCGVEDMLLNGANQMGCSKVFDYMRAEAREIIKGTMPRTEFRWKETKK